MSELYYYNCLFAVLQIGNFVLAMTIFISGVVFCVLLFVKFTSGFEEYKENLLKFFKLAGVVFFISFMLICIIPDKWALSKMCRVSESKSTMCKYLKG